MLLLQYRITKQSVRRIYMTKQEFLSELEAMLELEPGSISGSESLSDLAGWDSMATLSFIALADSKLGVVLSPAALAICRTIPDLIALVPGKIS